MSSANGPTATMSDATSAEAVAAASRDAVDRLVQSRARLRRALQGADNPPGGSAFRQAHHRATQHPSGTWLERVAGLPITRLVLDALAGQWRRHPWRASGLVADDVARAVLQPVAQRHPWRLVLISAVVGGLLASSRPWRWLPGRALLIGLAPQLVAQALGLPAVRGGFAALLKTQRVSGS